jgi:hypothetical protein
MTSNGLDFHTYFCGLEKDSFIYLALREAYEFGYNEGYGDGYENGLDSNWNP